MGQKGKTPREMEGSGGNGGEDRSEGGRAEQPDGTVSAGRKAGESKGDTKCRWGGTGTGEKEEMGAPRNTYGANGRQDGGE